MKKVFLFFCLVMSASSFFAQGVSINESGSAADASAMLDVSSSNKGVLVPRMTSTQRISIVSPATGLLVYDTTTNSFWYYNAGWNLIGSSSSSFITDLDGNTKIQTEKNSNENFIRFDVSGVQRALITDTGTFIIGNSSDYAKFETDGSLRYVGEATVYEDLTIPATTTKTQGNADPTFSVVKNNGSGSRGAFVYWFSPSSLQEIFFVVQMPHKWEEGSDIYPHVHWIAPTNAGSTKVQWGLEYVWANVGEVYGNTTIVTSNTVEIGGNADAYRHVITEFPSINGAGKTLSSMILCRLFRDAAAAADNYSGNAGLLQIDFHYKVDSDGSRQEYVK